MNVLSFAAHDACLTTVYIMSAHPPILDHHEQPVVDASLSSACLAVSVLVQRTVDDALLQSAASGCESKGSIAMESKAGGRFN